MSRIEVQNRWEKIQKFDKDSLRHLVEPIGYPFILKRDVRHFCFYSAVAIHGAVEVVGGCWVFLLKWVLCS